MVRTIEQILGIKPDEPARLRGHPDDRAFTSKPNYAPFTAVPNQTSLTLGLSPQPSCGANVPAGQTTASVAKANAAATAVPARRAVGGRAVEGLGRRTST